jgi:hypothetical protein
MPDRPDPASPGDPEGEAPPVAPVDPNVIFVNERPSRGSARLLPPLLILLLGLTFLAYRVRSSDWRGLSALFETRATSPAVKADDPSKALALKTDPPPPAAAPKPEAALEKATPLADKELPKAEAKAADPLDDIRKEAEKTKEKIAELEKLKEREAKRLDDTADERAEQERRERPLRRGLAQADIEKMLRRHRAMLDQQMAWMEQMHRQHRDRMSQMERDFFNGRMPMDMPMPGFNVPDRNRVRPGPDGIFRLPNGGVGRFRDFGGPNGPRGFVWEFRQGGPDAGQVPDDTPPPPEPNPDRPKGPRVFD